MGFPANFSKYSDERKKEWLFDRTREKFPKMPESLVNFTVGNVYSGDCGRSIDEKPDWLDIDRFQRGQKFVQKYLFGVSYNMSIVFFTIFSFGDLIKPLIRTKKSSSPYAAFRRYFSTALKVLNWCTEDPWMKGSPAYNDIEVVRRVHLSVRKNLLITPDEQIDEEATIENPWCDTRQTLLKDFEDSCSKLKPSECPLFANNATSSARFKGLNQFEMAATQFAFVGMIVLFPKDYGMNNATDEELDAFCYTWRCIGYLLGIEDE